MLLYILLGVVAAYLVALFSWRQQPRNTPPQEAGIVPWLGVAASFAKNPLKFVWSEYQKLGEIFTLKIAGQRLTFLMGPEAHVPFFAGGDDVLDQNEPYKFAVPIFGPGVIYDSPVHIRIQQLKFLRKSLGVSQMRTYVGKIVEETEMFFGKWGNETVVDVRDAFGELIILTASRCLMGNEVREHMFKEVSQLYAQLDEGLTPLSVFFPYLPIPAHRRRDEAREQMVALFDKVIQQRMANPEEQHDDVLQVFIDARYKAPEGSPDNGRPLTATEVAGLMIALLFAGQHTSSVVSSWTGLLLHDPQNKDTFLPPLVAEQDAILAEHEGSLDYDSLKKMNRLHRCVKEALRMHPPLILLMRKAQVPIKFKNYVIPKGDTLFVSPALCHRLPHVYTNPDQYDPERFAPDRAEDQKQPHSYLGFGDGRHACMGQNFAYLQIKAIWACLLRDFDCELVDPLPEPDYAAMVVGPKQPCRMRFTRRVKQ